MSHREICNGEAFSLGSSTSFWKLDLLDFDEHAKRNKISWWGLGFTPTCASVVVFDKSDLSSKEISEVAAPPGAVVSSLSTNHIEHLLCKEFERYGKIKQVKTQESFIDDQEASLLIHIAFENNFAIPGEVLVNNLKDKGVSKLVLLNEHDRYFFQIQVQKSTLTTLQEKKKKIKYEFLIFVGSWLYAVYFFYRWFMR